MVDVVEPLTVTVVVNTGDDMVLHGLHISPDLDTVTYTLAGLDNQVTGWGIVGETWTTMTELEALGGEPGSASATAIGDAPLPHGSG